jgi:thymidine phosphorylase
MEHNHQGNTLKLKWLGIDTYRENIIFMRSDCDICISEGFTALTRLLVSHKGKTIVATLDVIHSDLIAHGETALSEIAFKRLDAIEGDVVTVTHLDPIMSLSDVRAKIYGKKLDDSAFYRIISDINKGYYSDIELSAFISSCAGDNLDLDEIIGLTKAMVNTGSRLSWNTDKVLDKHCIGGLPGNRTTPIVVSIIAAAGLTIPKTSSRAITSPAGTADTMETITNVNLTLDKLKEVVNKEGGCIAWGGIVNLSPSDDILISIEKALDIDSEGQMIASVLSKKAAAGSTHVVIDMPVGKTAKVRTEKDALKLQYYFTAVGKSLGLNIVVLITDGSQPVGRGIGPSMEAMDIISILKNEKNAPKDLKEKAELIAGAMFELCETSKPGEGVLLAKQILESGKAWDKFYNICLAQGGFMMPVHAQYKMDVLASKSGVVKEIDNRRLAKVAKLAGAPKTPSSGIYFSAPIGTKVTENQVLYTIYSEAEGELNYALEYINSSNPIIIIE